MGFGSSVMDIVLSVIAFFVIFSLLVLIHECGHFYAALRVGIKVEEFGLGLPPRVWGWRRKKKGTLYSLNAIPFGGFVKMEGEDELDPKKAKSNQSFSVKSVWERSQVILAGVFMNFVLAWVLFTLLFTFGSDPIIVSSEDMKKQINAGNVVVEEGLDVYDVSPEGSAAVGGLEKGDKILRVNSVEVFTAEKVIEFHESNTSITYEVLREGKEYDISIVPNDEGKIGAALAQFPKVVEIKEIQLPLHKAALFSLTETARLSVLTVKMFGNLITSIVQKFTIPDGVAGPLGIAEMTHDLVQMGDIERLIKFTALLSLSLAVINIMPFPALDGGRFLFIIFEILARRPVPPKWEVSIHGIGYGLLLLLIFFVTWKDISRMFFS